MPVTHFSQEAFLSMAERKSMFEKPLTPSDVGKLNRLVIPKQQAEKYFPLAGDSGEKDLLLCFEDEAGKAWRFRYSYWTSSQSYVLTKGWSRFVKEKRLGAGDIVLFERTTGGERFYIGCRRRNSPPNVATNAALSWSQTYYSASTSVPSYMCMGSMQQDCFLERGEQTSSIAVPKRLRLFGVNLECVPDQQGPELVHSAPWFVDPNHDHRARFMP